MEMLYSPVSSPLSVEGLRSAATEVEAAIAEPPSSDIPTDACDAGSSSTNASSSNITSLDDDEGVSNESGGSPSRDSVLSLLGMRFLPISHLHDSSSEAGHPQSASGPLGQPSTSPGLASTQSSVLGHHQMAYPIVPSPSSSSSSGLLAGFSGMVFASPSSMSSSGMATNYQLQNQQNAYQHHQQQQLQYESTGFAQHQVQHQHAIPYALQTSSSYYPHLQQTSHNQHHPNCQHHQHHPSCHNHPMNQQSYLQQQQPQPSPYMVPYTPSSLLLEALMDPEHSPYSSMSGEPRVGAKRKAEASFDHLQQHFPQGNLYHQHGDMQLMHHQHHHPHQHDIHHPAQNAHTQPPHAVSSKAKKRRVRKTWTERYQQLKEFKQRFGHCKVPKGWSEDPKLARWVCNMRQSRRMGKMKEERIKKLNELGFLWRCEQTGKVIWEEMIDKLKAFQARHGHCRVPIEWPEDPQLAAWVLYVRQRHRANNLSQEKVRELESINFSWSDPVVTSANPAAAAQDQYSG